MKDFMGICVHTVQFKPELYRPICQHVRDYHGLNWDLGDETNHWPTFPMARNKVDWQSMYGKWVKAGYEIDACIMFGNLPFDKWVDPARDAETYGFSFARFFGPSGRNLVTAMEIGNEPGGLKDEHYRILFENMAKGVRAGDPKMKTVTCATIAGKSHKYAKSLECVKGFSTGLGNGHTWMTGGDELYAIDWLEGTAWAVGGFSATTRACAARTRRSWINRKRSSAAST